MQASQSDKCKTEAGGDSADKRGPFLGTSCSFSRSPVHQSPPASRDVRPTWPAEEGGILANGQRQFSISR